MILGSARIHTPKIHDFYLSIITQYSWKQSHRMVPSGPCTSFYVHIIKKNLINKYWILSIEKWSVLISITLKCIKEIRWPNGKNEGQMHNYEANNKRLIVESRWCVFTAEFFLLFCFKILKIEYWGEKNAWLAFLTRITACRYDTDMYMERYKHYTHLYI